jgi:hypothetical protein
LSVREVVPVIEIVSRTKNPMPKTLRWQWMLLGAVAFAALLLRAHHLSQISLWLDETDFFNEKVWGAHPQSLFDFAKSTKDATTNTWGWPAVIWISCRIFGPTVGIARMPSVVVGTAAVLLVFLLVYRLIPTNFAGSRFVPAIFAAAIAAMTMPQMEFSQRTYPYGAAPFTAAALLLTHLTVLQATLERRRSEKRLFRALVLYTIVASLALCIHPSLGLLVAASLAFLIARLFPGFLQQAWEERKRSLFFVLGASLILICSALLNAKNPKYGFRPYLVRYYHAPSLGSIPVLLKHAYDVFTYNLNPFYNTSLYWPEQVNWAILPLVLLCLWGWVRAASGKFGQQARHLAFLGLVALAMPALLSLRRAFPFGGVRQTLFLSPFFFVFTALGFYAFRSRRATRLLGMSIALLYVVFWALNLPRFYSDREPAYSAEDIVRAWQTNGKLPVYARGCEREVQYGLRGHPEIRIESLPLFSKPPYLLISTHWPPLEQNHMFAGFADYLQKSGYQATLVTQEAPKNLDSLQYSTCLYFPPNGLWIYKVTAP